MILCERGIRTFEPATRNTLDLSAVPVLRERSHLPVVGRSEPRGRRAPLDAPAVPRGQSRRRARLLIEVHPNPPEAKSDKEQALTFDDFGTIMRDLEQIDIWSQPQVRV